MCKAMEEMRKEELIEVVERLLKLKKLSYEEIAEITKLTVEEEIRSTGKATFHTSFFNDRKRQE